MEIIAPKSNQLITATNPTVLYSISSPGPAAERATAITMNITGGRINRKNSTRILFVTMKNKDERSEKSTEGIPIRSRITINPRNHSV
jgi:hypothetical protein